jgi:hypothetical protein
MLCGVLCFEKRHCPVILGCLVVDKRNDQTIFNKDLARVSGQNRDIDAKPIVEKMPGEPDPK